MTTYIVDMMFVTPDCESGTMETHRFSASSEEEAIGKAIKRRKCKNMPLRNVDVFTMTYDEK